MSAALGDAVDAIVQPSHSTIIDEERHQRAVNCDHSCLTSLDGLRHYEHLERVC